MKKIFLALAVGCIPALATMNGASAQNSSTNSIPKNEIGFNKSLATGNSTATGTDAVNARAIKHFSKVYKNVKDATWVPTDGGGYRAVFSLSGISNKVYYKKNGQWSATLKNYKEEKLPFEVRDMVKRAYYDFAISYVDEVETPESEGSPTYIVHIEDKDNYKFIRVCNGEMNVWKALKKQQP